MTPSYRERGEKLTPGAQTIFAYLVEHPLEFRKEIRHALKMPNGTFQYHLQVLEDCGLLRPVHYDGKTYYRILVRGAPRVAAFLARLGWDEAEPASKLAEVSMKVDEILLIADRAIFAHAARATKDRSNGTSDHYSALKALLVL
jgi:DNA-binding transcriptional ArsR family regulator